MLKWCYYHFLKFLMGTDLTKMSKADVSRYYRGPCLIWLSRPLERILAILVQIWTNFGLNWPILPLLSPVSKQITKNSIHGLKTYGKLVFFGFPGILIRFWPFWPKSCPIFGQKWLILTLLSPNFKIFILSAWNMWKIGLIWLSRPLKGILTILVQIGTNFGLNWPILTL